MNLTDFIQNERNVHSPGDLPNPGIESPTLQTDSLLSEVPGKPRDHHCNRLIICEKKCSKVRKNEKKISL